MGVWYGEGPARKGTSVQRATGDGHEWANHVSTERDTATQSKLRHRVAIKTLNLSGGVAYQDSFDHWEERFTGRFYSSPASPPAGLAWGGRSYI